MSFIALVGLVVAGWIGTMLFLVLLGIVLGQATTLFDSVLYLLGVGALFAIGYVTARWAFGLSDQQSMLVGGALPVAYGVGRLTWLKLGLPTPYSDYERQRRQDHRDFWN